jgi:tetratricopeptide (TPR) repeat protein
VDRGSTRQIWQELPVALERLRSGREEPRLAALDDLISSTAAGEDFFRRVFIAELDLDKPHQGEAKSALEVLANALEDPSQAQAAWSALIVDAGDNSAKRLLRTRNDLIDVLARHNIRVRPLGKSDVLGRRLDVTRDMLKRRHANAALAQLRQIDSSTEAKSVDPKVAYRIAQQTSAALHQLRQYKEALVAAQKALDIDPDGSHALNSAATAAMGLGDLNSALAYAERAVKAHPADGTTWGVLAKVRDARREPLPVPTAQAEATSEYRTLIADVAAVNGDWQRVLDLTKQLLTENDRSEEVLFLRAAALASIHDLLTPEEDQRPWGDVERLTTELLDKIADDSHPFVARALTLRALARRKLGHSADAEADISRARRSDPDDPDTIGHSAQGLINDGKFDEALLILASPVVETVTPLLVLRAKALVGLGKNDDARKSLATALSHIADTHQPDHHRIEIADTAIDLADVSFALQVLKDITPEHASSDRYQLVQGRLAFAKDDFTAAITAYRKAADISPGRRVDYLAELGTRLLAAGRAQHAVEVLKELSLSELPPIAVRALAAASMKLEDLSGARAILDYLAQSAPLPAWALAMATDIALRQEDVDTAIDHLSKLVSSPQATYRERIQLTRRLIERRRFTDAEGHIERLQKEKLDPLASMQLAQLLHQLHRDDEAIRLAYEAFRSAPENPELHRAFIMIGFMGRFSLPATEVVAEDTHVVIREKDGEVRNYTFYASPVRERGELGVGDAQAAGLLGKKVGDEVVRNPGSWMEQRWTVVSIVPSLGHDLADAAEHFEERFHAEPFFLTKFKIGDPDSVKSFAPLIGSLEARRTAVDKVFSMYQEQVVPLGAIVHLLGGTLPDIVSYLTGDGDNKAPYFVEWSNRDGQEESLLAASSASSVILTRSALETIDALDLFDLLTSTFKLVAPISLRDELQAEVDSASEAVARGEKTMVSVGGMLRFHELEPGHATLIARAEKAKRLLAFLESPDVDLAPRPLEVIQPSTSSEEKVRDLIGHGSLDALALAKQLKASLYADDLGLRKLLTIEDRQRSFSSVSLLQGLAQRGLVSAEDRDTHLVHLAQRHFAVIPPSISLLQRGLALTAGAPDSEVVKVLGLLTTLGPQDAARLAAQLLRAHAISSLQVMPLERLATLLIEVLALIMPPSVAATMLARSARAELKLLPPQLNEVLEVCARVARNVPDLSANRTKESGS